MGRWVRVSVRGSVGGLVGGRLVNFVFRLCIAMLLFSGAKIGTRGDIAERTGQHSERRA